MNYGKAGMDCTEIFSRAYDIAKKAHLEDYFLGHGDGKVAFIGHGLGLEISTTDILLTRQGVLWWVSSRMFSGSPMRPHGQ